MAASLLTALLVPAMAILVGVAPQSDHSIEPEQRSTISPAAPNRAAAEDLLRQLDEAFSRGDLQAFERCFAASHARQHAMLLDRLGPVIRPRLGLVRQSRLLRYWSLGEVGIALVRSETRAPGCERAQQPVIEHCLLTISEAARAGGSSGPVRANLCVEVADRWLPMFTAEDLPAPPAEIGCPACNYHLRIADDWLLVPNCPRRAGCLESATFFALDADLSGTLSIHALTSGHATGEEPVRLLRELAAAHGDTTRVEAESWMPPQHADDEGEISPLRGARMSIAGIDGERVTELYLASYGSLSYLLTFEGPRAVIAARRDELERMIAGFRLNDPTIDPQQLAAQVVTAHTGGSLEGVTYRNRRLQLTIAGPAGWMPAHCADQYAFDVSWLCPLDLGVLRAKGLEPPLGAERWTRLAADEMLARTMCKTGLSLQDDGGWTSPDEGSFHSLRSLELLRPDGVSVLLRFALADDLLVVMEGDVLKAPSEAPIRAAMDSLQRAR